MPELKTVTDPDLPEPKGISTALADQIYRADGAGSGSWDSVVLHGWEKYSHSGGSQSLTAATRDLVQNDTLGSGTSTGYGLPNSTGLWDSVNSQIDLSAGQANVGDHVTLVLDIDYVASAGGDDFTVEADFAVGGSSPFTVPIDEINVESAGTLNKLTSYDFPVLDADMLNNPMELYVTAATASDSVTINSILIIVKPRVLKVV